MNKQFIIPIVLIIAFGTLTYLKSIFIWPACLSFVILGLSYYHVEKSNKTMQNMQSELTELKDKVSALQFSQQIKNKRLL